MQTVRRPQALRFFFKLDIKLFSETAMSQRRNHTATTPQCHHVTVWWPYGGREVTNGFYPVLGG